MVHDKKQWRKLNEQSRDVTFLSFKKPGDAVEGTYRGTAPGKFGTNCLIESDGTTYAFSQSATLQDLDDVDVGTEIRIEFIGRGESARGREFKRFDLFVADTPESSSSPTPKPLEADDQDVPF